MGTDGSGGGQGPDPKRLLGLFSKAEAARRRIDALPPWLHPRRSVPTAAVVVIALVLVLPLLRGDGGVDREARFPLREGRFDAAADRARSVVDRAARATVGPKRAGQWGRTSFHGEFGAGFQINLDATFGEPGTGDPIRLAVVCTAERQELDVYISWSATRYLGKDGGKGNGWKHVSLQSGGSQITERWLLTADNRSTFAPDPGSLLERIRKSDQIRARLADSEWAVFDIAGLDEALSPLREGCGMEI